MKSAISTIMIDNYIPICEYIKMKRSEMDLTQVGLAKESKVSEKSIQLIEAKKKVKPKTLDKVLNVFNKQLVVNYSFSEIDSESENKIIQK